jgi:hypothetical protein
MDDRGVGDLVVGGQERGLGQDDAENLIVVERLPSYLFADPVPDQIAEQHPRRHSLQHEPRRLSAGRCRVGDQYLHLALASHKIIGRTYGRKRLFRGEPAVRSGFP